jgi:hypothetical protein
MNARLLASLASALGLAAVLVLGNAVRTQEPPPPPQPDQNQPADGGAVGQEGVQVQTRGPVHEAFAEPAIRGPRATPVVPKQPPDPIDELPPDQKPAGENVRWIPGYWAWEDDRSDFIWVSGVWRSLPPGRSWVPGTWNQADDGWQWVPGYWASAEQDQVNYLPEPPDPVNESVAEAPSADDVYIPGSWEWRDTRYLWRPGFWTSYRPGWLWVPAHYIWTPAGYLFVAGYWDFPLADRGLLFAPVVIDRRFWGRANWFYQPSYVVPDTFLVGSLFVRLNVLHYYFGDYFEARYVDLGFTPWVDFRIGRYAYDPLFSYYRWQYRDNPTWVRDLRNVYVGRREGTIARPPRTVVVNNTTINNVTNITNVRNITNIVNAPAAAPLALVRRSGAVALRPLTRDQVMQERKVVQEVHQAAIVRARTEREVIAKGSPLKTGQIAPARLSTSPIKSQAITSERTGAATAGTAAARVPPPQPRMPTPQPHPAATAGRPSEPGRATERRERGQERATIPQEPNRTVPNERMTRPPQEPARTVPQEPNRIVPNERATRPPQEPPRPTPAEERARQPGAAPGMRPGDERTRPAPRPTPQEERARPQPQPQPPPERRAPAETQRPPSATETMRPQEPSQPRPQPALERQAQRAPDMKPEPRPAAPPPQARPQAREEARPAPAQRPPAEAHRPSPPQDPAHKPPNERPPG